MSKVVKDRIARHEDEPVVELTPEQEAALEESIAEIERGEFVDGDEFLRKLLDRSR